MFTCNPFLCVVLPFAIALALVGCGRNQLIRFEGETQGTTYHITVAACATTQSERDLQRRVIARLAEIDRALSNYRNDSELSEFNRAPLGEWSDLGGDLYSVLRASQRISTESEGAFDITVAPLVDLWGFGPHKSEEPTLPPASAIDALRAEVGFTHLRVDDQVPRALKETSLAIDVNGIAQGYTVDQLANVLTAQGCTDFLVEVGGELRLVGLNGDRKPWRIGIETPGDGITPAQEAITATGVGVTTAGDYHDYFEKDGVRYSHTIDPRTGRPIAHKLASVTVVASNATDADGYDTVLEVLGPEAGLSFAEAHGIAAYFIVRDGSGFKNFHSSAMEKYLLPAK